MPPRKGNFKTLAPLLVKNWQIKLLSVVSALLLWLFVVAKNKVPFQVEVEVVPPNGYEVFPKKVLVAGKISEKFFNRKVFECFKVRADRKGYVRVENPVPFPFVEIDTIFPKKVQVKRKD